MYELDLKQKQSKEITKIKITIVVTMKEMQGDGKREHTCIYQ